MHHVKRAIIMAAGVGKRMRPVTWTTPKPLVRVNGVRMIDTAIRGLHRQGIFEIYVVVGYRKEQFRSLEAEYPGLHLVENPDYDSCNNISSLYAARAYLEDAVILDGDQLIRSDAVLAPDFERSGYCCAWCTHQTDEWLLTVRDGRVCACSRTGGSHGWQLFSVSFWSAEDGARLRRHLETEFVEKRNRQLYWDDVALFCYPQAYALGIREVRYGDILEIDSLEELAALDPAYRSAAGMPPSEVEECP